MACHVVALMTGYPPKKARALPASRPRPHPSLDKPPRAPRLPAAGRLDPRLCRSPRAHMRSTGARIAAPRYRSLQRPVLYTAAQRAPFPAAPATGAQRSELRGGPQPAAARSRALLPRARPHAGARRGGAAAGQEVPPRPLLPVERGTGDRATGTVRDRSASLLGLYRDPYRDRRASVCRDDADTLSS